MAPVLAHLDRSDAAGGGLADQEGHSVGSNAAAIAMATPAGAGASCWSTTRW
jgi:hypothetical protein